MPHAALDLVEGRVRFFEVEESTGLYRHYALSDRHSPHCLARAELDERLPGLPLPRDTCLERRAERAPHAGYELTGYARPGTEPPGEVALVRRSDGQAVARYRWFDHPGARTCPVDVRTHGGHPLWNLTSFVLPDRLGRTETVAPQPLADPQGELIPPPARVREALEHAALLPPPCAMPPLPAGARVLQLQARTGGAQLEARLDAQGSRADFAIVDLNLPEEPVVLLATAEQATLWHLHRARDSQLFAVILRGARGQGLEGLPPDTHVLMATDAYNPGAHCNASELEAIAAELRPRAQALTPLPPERRGDALHFAIGEPMREGQQHFSFERPRAEFEVRED